MRKIEEVFVNGVSLKKILDNHKKWLNLEEGGERIDLSFFDADLSFVNLMGVNLGGAFLRGVNLTGANLYNANLRATDLRCSNLSKTLLTSADLSRSDLSNAILSESNLEHCDLFCSTLPYADLSHTNLYYANLSSTDLAYANLSYAKLRCSNLKYADLKYANLCNADLTEADLNNSNLRHANLLDVEYSENTAFFVLQCPEEGSFIGYKKANNKIVKLLITKDAKRSSATTRKCRCSKAKVLSITNIDNTREYRKVASNYDKNFIYRVGEIVEVDDFNEDRWSECSTGIHFFLTRGEAIKYQN